MTTLEFINKYCVECGSQHCLGPITEFAEGCPYYIEELKKVYITSKYEALLKEISEREK